MSDTGIELRNRKKTSQTEDPTVTPDVKSLSPSGLIPSTVKTKPYHKDLIPSDLLNQLVYDCPDLNRTASLYSRTDLYKCLTDLLHDMLPECGFPEYGYYQDVRLLLCIITVITSGVVVVGLKFPADQFEILIGVICFIILVFAVGVIDMKYTGPETVYITQTSKGDPVWVSLGFPEFGSELRWACWQGVDRESGKEPTELIRGVERYFDEEGFCVHENLFDDFCHILEKHTGELNIDQDQIFDFKGE